MPSADRKYYVNEITDNSDQIAQPLNWKIKLKNHQLSLVRKCIDLENNGVQFTDDEYLDCRFENIKSNIGVIADKVGSGKSFSILALIETNKRPLVQFKHTQMYGFNNINVQLKDTSHEYTKCNANLIVVPHSIIKQWDNCIKAANPNFTYYIVNTTKALNKLDDKLKQSDIILISGTFYRKVQEHIFSENYFVNRVFFDEADSMNTPNAKHIPANFYWFVSASFKNILNPYPRWNYEYRNWENSYLISSGISNNAYVKNIFMSFYKTKNQVLNRLIDKIVIRNSDEYVEQSFNLPELNRHIIKCKDSGIISILNGVVQSNIIQCLNAGDTLGAISYVNQENVDTESNIINAVKQGLNIKLNNINVELRIANETIYLSEEIKRRKIQKLEQEQESILNKMKLIEDRILQSELCMICLDTQTTKTITKCCNNAFCLKCLTEWLKRKPACPLCKKDINVENDIFIVKDPEFNQMIEEPDPTKLAQFNKMLRDIKSNTKMLIFSEYDNSFVDIENSLKASGIKYAKLKGNSINKNVYEYRNGDLQVLLVNSHAYGSGLNLENTTDVVLFHKFDNDIETQIIGRAQRPGRTTSLNVWYLLNANEITNNNTNNNTINTIPEEI